MSYHEKLLRETARLTDSGGLHVVAVYHDDDCPKLAGGACTCNPSIEVSEPMRDTAEAAERIRRQRKFGPRWRD